MTGFWGESTNMPRTTASGGVLAYEVVTVNADGTVDLRNRKSRATRARVPGIAGWTPSVRDLVLAVDVGDDPQTPAVIAVQHCTIPFGS